MRGGEEGRRSKVKGRNPPRRGVTSETALNPAIRTERRIVRTRSRDALPIRGAQDHRVDVRPTVTATNNVRPAAGSYTRPPVPLMVTDPT